MMIENLDLQLSFFFFSAQDLSIVHPRAWLSDLDAHSAHAGLVLSVQHDLDVTFVVDWALNFENRNQPVQLSVDRT